MLGLCLIIDYNFLHGYQKTFVLKCLKSTSQKLTFKCTLLENQDFVQLIFGTKSGLGLFENNSIEFLGMKTMF